MKEERKTITLNKHSGMRSRRIASSVGRRQVSYIYNDDTIKEHTDNESASDANRGYSHRFVTKHRPSIIKHIAALTTAALTREISNISKVLICIKTKKMNSH